jgi:hypothetical protein
MVFSSAPHLTDDCAWAYGGTLSLMSKLLIGTLMREEPFSVREFCKVLRRHRSTLQRHLYNVLRLNGTKRLITFEVDLFMYALASQTQRRGSGWLSLMTLDSKQTEQVDFDHHFCCGCDCICHNLETLKRNQLLLGGQETTNKIWNMCLCWTEYRFNRRYKPSRHLPLFIFEFLILSARSSGAPPYQLVQGCEHQP